MPTTLEAIILIALVISPGYVCARFARDVISLTRDPGDLRFLLPAITCGTLVHVVIFPWSIRILDHYQQGSLRDHSLQFVVWGLVTGFALPITLGVGISQLAKRPQIDRLLDRIGMGYVERMPSAWEYVIRLKRSAYVRIHLKGQTVPIGGRFTQSSFASTTLKEADLFIQQVWQLDENGDFVRPLLDNWGAWISHDTISHIEFFNEENGVDEPVSNAAKE